MLVYVAVLTVDGLGVGEAVGLGLLLVALAASYYSARARKMVRQYPWLYESNGPFGWRPKRSAAPD